VCHTVAHRTYFYRRSRHEQSPRSTQLVINGVETRVKGSRNRTA
jgi:hypothetical protein